MRSAHSEEVEDRTMINSRNQAMNQSISAPPYQECSQRFFHSNSPYYHPLDNSPNYKNTLPRSPQTFSSSPHNRSPNNIPRFSPNSSPGVSNYLPVPSPNAPDMCSSSFVSPNGSPNSTYTSAPVPNLLMPPSSHQFNYSSNNSCNVDRRSSPNQNFQQEQQIIPPNQFDTQPTIPFYNIYNQSSSPGQSPSSNEASYRLPERSFIGTSNISIPIPSTSSILGSTVTEHNAPETTGILYDSFPQTSTHLSSITTSQVDFMGNVYPPTTNTPFETDENILENLSDLTDLLCRE